MRGTADFPVRGRGSENLCRHPPWGTGRGCHAKNPVFKQGIRGWSQMAKDGTARGGARPGSGPKKKALTEKISAGMAAEVMELPEPPMMEGADMPPVKEFLKAKQKGGKDLCAEEVFRETWKWLKERGCERLVGTQLLEQYAMSVSRWVMCEIFINEYGMLARHPTSGNPIASPYVSMSQQYMKQVNQIWYQIYQIVKENCSVEWQGATPQDDVMEQLLRARNRA